jgi:four helix bundle protein
LIVRFYAPNYQTLENIMHILINFIRCSCSVGANYRASQRAKSTADFINKLKIVEEEADESNFFLEILLEINKNKELKVELDKLLKEGNEILAIIVASIKTARNNQNKT